MKIVNRIVALLLSSCLIADAALAIPFHEFGPMGGIESHRYAPFIEQTMAGRPEFIGDEGRPFDGDKAASRVLYRPAPQTSEPQLPGHYDPYLYALNLQRTSIVPYRLIHRNQITDKMKRRIAEKIHWWGYIEPAFQNLHLRLVNTLDYDLGLTQTSPKNPVDLSRLWVVLASNGNVVGYALVSTDERIIKHLIIQWDYRRCGIALELFCAGLKEILNQNIPGEITLVDVYPEMKQRLISIGMPHEMVSDGGKFYYALFRGEKRRYQSNSLLSQEEAAHMIGNEQIKLAERIQKYGVQLPSKNTLLAAPTPQSDDDRGLKLSSHWIVGIVVAVLTAAQWFFEPSAVSMKDGFSLSSIPFDQLMAWSHWHSVPLSLLWGPASAMIFIAIYILILKSFVISVPEHPLLVVRAGLGQTIGFWIAMHLGDPMILNPFVLSDCLAHWKDFPVEVLVFIMSYIGVHQAGHAIFGKLAGAKIEKTSHLAKTHTLRQRIIYLLGGPIANLVVGIISLVALRAWLAPSSSMYSIFQFMNDFMIFNIAIGLGALLPFSFRAGGGLILRLSWQLWRQPTASKNHLPAERAA